MIEIRKENLNYDEDDIREQLDIYNEIMHNSKFTFTLYLLAGIIIFPTGLALLINNIEKGNGVNYYGIILLIISAVAFYMHLTIRKRFIKRYMKNIVENDDRPVFIMNCDGLKEVYKNSESFYKWEAFVEYILLPKHLLLFANSKDYRIFSKKFYTNEEWILLLDWVKFRVKVKHKEVDLVSLKERYIFRKPKK